ncbi:MAG: hypothetical protein ACRDRX_06165 [Pseudonocardiaceae bacterium]
MNSVAFAPDGRTLATAASTPPWPSAPTTAP